MRYKAIVETQTLQQNDFALDVSWRPFVHAGCRTDSLGFLEVITIYRGCYY